MHLNAPICGSLPERKSKRRRRDTFTIQTQEAHHRKMIFEQELIALLEKHGVPTIRNTY